MSARRWFRALVSAAALVGVGLGSVAPAGSAVVANDPEFVAGHQWPLAQIGAAAAWTRSTGAGITIGVVDTGVDLRHEDLAGKVVASTNCIGSNGDPSACQGAGQDDNGHGSHVSGTAAAITGNGRGIAGVAPDARLVVAKALDNKGQGNTDDINAGIEWVVSQGARVVNLSLGPEFTVLNPVVGSGIESGIEYAWQHGAIPVLAAGNTNILGVGSANYGDLDAVVVGATGPDDTYASDYSSPTGNAKWAIIAPGGDGFDSQGRPCKGSSGSQCVLSTFWVDGQANAYAYDEGTSMAAPHVAGVLALLLAQGLGQQAAVNQLLASANAKVSCGSGSPTCHGRLDAAKAVGAPAGAGSPTASATGSPSPGQAQAAPTAAAAPTTRRPAAGAAAPGLATTRPPVTAPPTSPPATAAAPGAAQRGSGSAVSGQAAGPTTRSRHQADSPVLITALVALGLAVVAGGLAAGAAHRTRTQSRLRVGAAR